MADDHRSNDSRYLEPELQLPRLDRHMRMTERRNRSTRARRASRDEQLLSTWIYRRDQFSLQGHGMSNRFHTGYAYLGGTTFPCTSHWPGQSLTTTITVTYTQIDRREQSLDSYTVTRVTDGSTEIFTTWGSFTSAEIISTGGTLFAMAPPLPSPFVMKTGSGGLSTGATAGIGIGVAVAFIILAATFFACRRGRTKRRLRSTVRLVPQDAGGPQLRDDYGKSNLQPPTEMAVYEQPRELTT
ncbi:hypothetical protein N8I77_009340 [Diaporthe amygdali]|uniref:Uncharacterized protein n=1 Tax=Phomopsis amygdali TaxID=1214568 RepID=A0AAD9SAU4_PHOAM|nr:hypothetical protein N8I77_009340 [Diaporthe amygdali]